MAKKVTAAELSRIRNRNVKRMKKAGARPDQIKSYLKGWQWSRRKRISPARVDNIGQQHCIAENII